MTFKSTEADKVFANPVIEQSYVQFHILPLLVALHPAIW